MLKEKEGIKHPQQPPYLAEIRQLQHSPDKIKLKTKLLISRWKKRNSFHQRSRYILAAVKERALRHMTHIQGFDDYNTMNVAMHTEGSIASVFFTGAMYGDLFFLDDIEGNDALESVNTRWRDHREYQQINNLPKGFKKFANQTFTEMLEKGQVAAMPYSVSEIRRMAWQELNNKNIFDRVDRRERRDKIETYLTALRTGISKSITREETTLMEGEILKNVHIDGEFLEAPLRVNTLEDSFAELHHILKDLFEQEGREDYYQEWADDFHQVMSDHLHAGLQNHDTNMTGKLLSVDEYIDLREKVSGMYVAIKMAQLTLPPGLPFPSQGELHEAGIYEDMEILEQSCARIGALGNDIISLEREIKKGTDFNLVTIILKNNPGMSVVEAIDKATEIVNQETVTFLDTATAIEKKLRSCKDPTFVKTINAYLKRIDQLVSATWHWQVGTNRYKSWNSMFEELVPKKIHVLGQVYIKNVEAQKVKDFVSDLSKDHLWYPGMAHSELIQGDGGPGTTYREIVNSEEGIQTEIIATVLEPDKPGEFKLKSDGHLANVTTFRFQEVTDNNGQQGVIFLIDSLVDEMFFIDQQYMNNYMVKTFQNLLALFDRDGEITILSKCNPADLDEDTVQ